MAGMEKRGVIEEGRTPPLTRAKQARDSKTIAPAREPLEDDLQRRAADLARSKMRPKSD